MQEVFTHPHERECICHNLSLASVLRLPWLSGLVTFEWWLLNTKFLTAIKLSTTWSIEVRKLQYASWRSNLRICHKQCLPVCSLKYSEQDSWLPIKGWCWSPNCLHAFKNMLVTVIRIVSQIPLRNISNKTICCPSKVGIYLLIVECLYLWEYIKRFGWAFCISNIKYTRFY